ncbi:MAG: hypothetical protein ABH858_04950 [Candidatus Omnitrophota bacterium]
MKKVIFSPAVCLFVFLAGCQSKDSSLVQLTPSPLGNKPQEAVSGKEEPGKIYNKDSVGMLFKLNPFLTAEEENIFTGSGHEIIQYLDLSAILHAARDPYAIIDGRVIKEKDILDHKEVVAINKEDVILKDTQGKTYTVKLKGIVAGE